MDDLVLVEARCRKGEAEGTSEEEGGQIDAHHSLPAVRACSARVTATAVMKKVMADR